MTLDTTEAAAAWDTLEEEAAKPAANYRHYRPLASAAEEFVREAQDQNRIYTGIAAFDREMRGFGSGQLLVVTGYSHSGKTQLVMRILRHNKAKRIAFFIPDEPATLILSKLASIESGVAARELEARVATGDAEAIRILKDTALKDFPNLAVFDKPLLPNVMEEGLKEVSEVWGAPPDLIVVDYVELVQAGETVQSKFDFLKGFGSRHEIPVLAIHQTSRSAGAGGQKMTISSGSYGGEQHATMMIGVWRRKNEILAQLEEQRTKAKNGSEAAAEKVAELEHDLKIHQYTISANLVKNKRPGGMTLEDGIDLEIDVDTGRLYDMPEGDLPNQYQIDREQARTTAPTQPKPAGWEQTSWDEGFAS